MTPLDYMGIIVTVVLAFAPIFKANGFGEYERGLIKWNEEQIEKKLKK